MNFERYLKEYTGYGTSVTMIDTAVTIDKENITHYKYKNGSIVNCHAEDYDSTIVHHGTICAEAILCVAPNVNLNAICVDENFSITERALIQALEFAFSKLKNDIICICLALEECSPQLIEILNKFEKTFIFASGSKDKVLFPSDLATVIKVYFDDEVEGINIISENNIAININETEEIYKSSSLSCAYFSGIFSLVLEEKVLWQFEEVKNYLFPIKENSVDFRNRLELPRQFYAIFPLKYLEYKNNFIDNLVGYYDSNIKACSFNNVSLLESHKTIYINENENKKVFSPTTIGDYFVGNFVENESESKINLLNHNDIDGKYVCEIPQPIIAITSFGYGSSKFDLQLKLYNNITKLDFNVKCTTYNPMGILFKNFTTFEYPKPIKSPNIIYSINKTIYETAIADDTDIFILNIGGSIRTINYHNSYDMGILFENYMKAFRIDIIILCVNINISIDTILFEIKRLKSNGIAEVIIVISDNQYDLESYESATGLKYFKCNLDEQMLYAEKLRDEYNSDSVYLLNEFDSIDTVKAIVEKFI